MTVRIMRFTKLLLGLGLAACAWPLSGQNARQEIYADPDKAGGVYYAYTVSYTHLTLPTNSRV